MYRNVIILSICQALSMSGVSIILTVGALVGQTLAPTPGLVTLPLALQFAATTCTTIPASMLMARVGRRIGFTLGQSLGVAGAGLCAYAVYVASFEWILIGSVFVGAHSAFWQYYRFAAADTATDDFRPRAISYVMAGGIFAAVAGPQLAKWTAEISVYTFMASYIAIIGLSFVAIILLQFVRIPRPKVTKFGGGRPIGDIMRTPIFIIAVLSSTVGYGVMNMLMTSTPLAMVFCGFAFNTAATVIQWHVLAMFLPSFVTGHLIKRYGVINIIIIGMVLLAAAISIALSGIAFANFWFGLVLLGIGWNFTFVGGTTLLTEAYTAEERAKTQAAHDFIVFGTVAFTALLSGMIHETLGWASINVIAALPVALAFMAVVWYRGRAAKMSTT